MIRSFSSRYSAKTRNDMINTKATIVVTVPAVIAMMRLRLMQAYYHSPVVTITLMFLRSHEVGLRLGPHRPARAPIANSPLTAGAL